jgi:hypothetical protein
MTTTYGTTSTSTVDYRYLVRLVKRKGGPKMEREIDRQETVLENASKVTGSRLEEISNQIGGTP